MNDTSAFFPAVVQSVQDLTPTVRQLTLDCPGPVQATPGAHIEVLVPGAAPGAGPLRRAYSVVRVAEGRRLTIAVKRLPDSRGGSAGMWALQPGQVLSIAPPRCHFELALGAPQYLLIAGGIGVTPIVPMALALARRGAAVRMVYGARSQAEFAYRDELAAALGDGLALFAADDGQVLDIGAEIARLHPQAEAYLCGPIGLMDAVREAWAAQGRAPSRLRMETFGASGHRPSQPFVVQVPRLGIEVQVPENQSLLDALTAAGVGVLSGCRRGECGLCALDVVTASAALDHRDVFFSREQQARGERLCACVSRAEGGTLVVSPAWRGDPDLGRPEVLQTATA